MPLTHLPTPTGVPWEATYQGSRWVILRSSLFLLSSKFPTSVSSPALYQISCCGLPFVWTPMSTPPLYLHFQLLQSGLPGNLLPAPVREADQPPKQVGDPLISHLDLQIQPPQSHHQLCSRPTAMAWPTFPPPVPGD